MRKHFLPGTYVPGASPVLNKLGQHVRDAKDVPLWNKAKPVAFTLHFKNASAKTRTVARIIAEGKDPDVLTRAGLPLTAYAEPKDVVKVPVYRGLNCRVAGAIIRQIRKAA